jgi:transposase
VRDTDLYQQLLGLESPWTVSRVQLDIKAQRVSVWAEHGKETTFPCPECARVCGLYDHEPERGWRHLDSCHFETLLYARVPRVQCPEHGVRQARVPWAEARSRFTLLFERFAIDVLLQTDVAGAARILGISWDEAHGIMQRAVERGLSRRERTVPVRIGVDEKALAKGHRYATLVNDLDRAVVVDVAEGRTKESLYTCLGSFSMNDLAEVQAIAMDMWAPFVGALKTVVQGAEDKIVFDRFHVIGHMNDALDQVRRAENKALRAEGDNRLVGSKHLWLYAAENVPEHRDEEFRTLRRMKLRTARAWSMKELLRGLWDCPSKKQGQWWWARWKAWADRCRLPPVKKVAAMIARHLPNVLTYFEHRITNAASESINSVVQLLKKRAFGYRSFPNFRTAVLFRCGGLDLYPSTHPISG